MELINRRLLRHASEIPWHAIIAQRNVLAHQYDVVERHAPPLIVRLADLVPEPPTDPEPD